MSETEKIIELDINLLVPNPYQPRKTFDENKIKELASSIKEYGIINPILVRKKDDHYEIIAGERRTRAAKSIGLTKVPVIIKELSDAEMAEISLLENLQRENLTPIEEAESYKQIIDLANLSQESLGAKLGKSQAFIANKIRLLTLPKEIQDALNNRKISERHARSLLTISDRETQIKLLNKIISERLTVKELDNQIKELKLPNEEIKTTISDIMTSLKNNEKEEKESDNMNNGNFFPNYNNQINPNQNLNNASLNSLNFQSMNPTQNIMNETVMPTTNNVEPSVAANPFITASPVQPTQESPSVQAQPVSTTEQVSPMPTIEPVQPLFNFEPPVDNNPIPTFTQEMPVNNPTSTPAVEPSVNVETMPQVEQPTQIMPDVPLFNSDLTMPQTPEVNVEPVATSSAPIEPTPIFSTPDIAPPTPSIEQPSYEVPITNTPSSPVEVDKLTKTKQFLEESGIPYKLYSNETNHCIIIQF